MFPLAVCVATGGASGQPDGERDELRADPGRRRQAHHLPGGEPERHHPQHGHLLDH